MREASKSDNIRLDNIRSWLVRSLVHTMCLTGSTGLFTLLYTYFFGYSCWRCPSQSYPVSVPEVSMLQIRTKRWEYTAWRDVGAQWNSRGAFTRYRPLWWNDHVMTVYMSSNSMKVISSQFWYLRSIPHHDPANHLHPEIHHLYTFMWCILCRCGMKG